MITVKEYEILDHASSNGRYVTGDPFVLEMAARGLLKDYGPQALADGAHYFETTSRGRAALNEYRATLPKPKKRRVSRAFESWERYTEACGNVPFKTFLKDVWPNYKSR